MGVDSVSNDQTGNIMFGPMMNEHTNLFSEKLDIIKASTQLQYE
jgi:hypothetical protein